jgi:periplasmic protein CpxP/Spy
MRVTLRRDRMLLVVRALAATVIVGGAGARVVMGQAVAQPPSDTPTQTPAAGGFRRGPFAGGQPLMGGPRQQLEQRLRMQFEMIVRQRLQLTDAQVVQLRSTNQQFAPQRRALAAREREIRQTMRAELQPGSTPNEQGLSGLTDSLFALQRTRLDMLQTEQRQLATFLTPSQRVRYYALQEQLRRRVEALRQRQLRGGQGTALGAPDGNE